MVTTLQKYWTELSAFVGILLTVLTATGQFSSFLPVNIQGYIATAIGVVTWLATTVFHRSAVAAAKASAAPPAA